MRYNFDFRTLVIVCSAYSLKRFVYFPQLQIFWLPHGPHAHASTVAHFISRVIEKSFDPIAQRQRQLQQSEKLSIVRSRNN